MNPSADLDHFPSPPPILAAFLPPHGPAAAASAGDAGFRLETRHQKPRKKRSKVLRLEGPAPAPNPDFPRPKPRKKPDPAAEKVTRPCSECGRTFWSWKALFGHMRCHPERQWRGINPPPSLRRPVSPEPPPAGPAAAATMTEDDQEVAASLLMLANGPTGTHSDDGCVRELEMAAAESAAAGQIQIGTHLVGVEEIGSSTLGGGGGDGVMMGATANLVGNCRFECSSCKKVFGSHQALGGHRASHKNVKGCFAIARNDGEDCENGLHLVENGGFGEERLLLLALGQHRCSICLKVFSSGQALGGHKRCHWERGDDQSLSLLTQLGHRSISPVLKEGSGLDLNLPAPLEDHQESSSSSYSSGLALDLRLGI